MYDIVIIGGGPAGVAAGIYAARKKMRTCLITDMFGGQSIVSNDIQNFIGIKTISGFELAKNLEEHLRAQESIEVMSGDRAITVTKKNEGDEIYFEIATEAKKTIQTKTVLVTSGSRRRKLDIPGEKEFDGRGVAYCATCDAPLFRGKKVALVGGGNSALEGVRDLIPYASEIFLFVRNEIKGDPITFEKIIHDPKVRLIQPAEIQEIKGNEMISSIRYKLVNTNEIKEMPIEGVFIEIGWIPNSIIVKDFVSVNAGNEIIVDHKTQKTSCDGIWAAGDVTDALYKQNNTSMGDAIKAVLNINNYLHRK